MMKCFAPGSLEALQFNLVVLPTGIAYFSVCVTLFSLSLGLLPLGAGLLIAAVLADALHVFCTHEIKLIASLPNAPAFQLPEEDRSSLLRRFGCPFWRALWHFFFGRFVLSILCFIVACFCLAFFCHPALMRVGQWTANWMARVMACSLGLTQEASKLHPDVEQGPDAVAVAEPVAEPEPTEAVEVMVLPEKLGSAKHREAAPPGLGTVELLNATAADNCLEVVRALYEHVKDGTERCCAVQHCSKYAAFVPESDMSELHAVSNSREMLEMRRRMEKETKRRAPRLRFVLSDGTVLKA